MCGDLLSSSESQLCKLSTTINRSTSTAWTKLPATAFSFNNSNTGGWFKDDEILMNSSRRNPAETSV